MAVAAWVGMDSDRLEEIGAVPSVAFGAPVKIEFRKMGTLFIEQADLIVQLLAEEMPATLAPVHLFRRGAQTRRWSDEG